MKQGQPTSRTIDRIAAIYGCVVLTDHASNFIASADVYIVCGATKKRIGLSSQVFAQPREWWVERFQEASGNTVSGGLHLAGFWTRKPVEQKAIRKIKESLEN